MNFYIDERYEDGCLNYTITKDDPNGSVVCTHTIMNIQNLRECLSVSINQINMMSSTLKALGHQVFINRYNNEQIQLPNIWIE